MDEFDDGGGFFVSVWRQVVAVVVVRYAIFSLVAVFYAVFIYEGNDGDCDVFGKPFADGIVG